MNENEIAKLVVDVCFRIHTQYGQVYLKAFTRKYFVMNGVRLEFLLRDNKRFHCCMKK